MFPAAYSYSATLRGGSEFTRLWRAPAAQAEFSTAPTRFRCAVGTETHRAKAQVAL